ARASGRGRTRAGGRGRTRAGGGGRTDASGRWGPARRGDRGRRRVGGGGRAVGRHRPAVSVGLRPLPGGGGGPGGPGPLHPGGRGPPGGPRGGAPARCRALAAGGRSPRPPGPGGPLPPRRASGGRPGRTTGGEWSASATLTGGGYGRSGQVIEAVARPVALLGGPPEARGGPAYSAERAQASSNSSESSPGCNWRRRMARTQAFQRMTAE